jgi:hypothetical protein
LNTFSSLLNWKRQLEKLKVEVDQAFSRVCEGLLEFGPGLKPRLMGGRERINSRRKGCSVGFGKIRSPTL